MKSAPQANLVPHIIDLIGVSFDKKFAPCQRMASAIINVSIKNGRCEPRDLLSLGFTRQETADLWHMASAMAGVELRLIKRAAWQRNNRGSGHVVAI
jgi:hypothetical protein